MPDTQSLRLLRLGTPFLGDCRGSGSLKDASVPTAELGTPGRSRCGEGLPAFQMAAWKPQEQQFRTELQSSDCALEDESRNTNQLSKRIQKCLYSV